MDEISHQAAVNDDLKSNANAHLLHVGLPQVDDESHNHGLGCDGTHGLKSGIMASALQHGSYEPRDPHVVVVILYFQDIHDVPKRIFCNGLDAHDAVGLGTCHVDHPCKSS